ncbi:hypothetical protein E2K93_01650 [Thalassotalea sp. HSM 43]|uniref:hypothetical protein n=1 Tax=Thalassotalea sp. HSM 43 TaxID=2552945 RepID=UPI001080D571|nr:hypothetical protein [Thalassotalea sp. HSM 43]QBY03151.1 hypothetical protein E2K93_01650 [Thalassotalea sp. HSM 43]
MNRKYIALTVSLFFASSGAALTAVDSDELSSYSDSAVLFDLYDQEYNEDEQNEYIKEQEQKKAERDAALAGAANYSTDSDVIILETKEDKRKLEEQRKVLIREEQSRLTQNLNEDARRKLEEQMAQTGEPAKSQATSGAAAAVAASQTLPESDTTDAQQEVVAQNQPKTFDELRALDLEPPIPPGTLGGGNGNGGPGGGAITPSVN